MSYKKVKCEKCFKFYTRRGMSLHSSKAHPYVPPPPPAREWVSYADLVREKEWGCQMSIYEKGRPDRTQLQLGYLMVIHQELKKLNRRLDEIFK